MCPLQREYCVRWPPSGISLIRHFPCCATRWNVISLGQSQIPLLECKKLNRKKFNRPSLRSNAMSESETVEWLQPVVYKNVGAPSERPIQGLRRASCTIMLAHRGEGRFTGCDGFGVRRLSRAQPRVGRVERVETRWRD